MLELPEAEVLRKDLDKEVVGKRVDEIEVRTPSLVRPFHHTRPQFQEELAERKIEVCRRRGSVIFLDLDEDRTWVLDLRGQATLHRETMNEPPGDQTHLRVTFTIGGAIHLDDPEEEPTASVGVVATERAFEEAGINPEAMDPLDDNPTWMDFRRLLHEARVPLHEFIYDGDYTVGLREVYVDEILWESGLRHDRPSQSLSTQEVRRFYRSIQEIIQAAIKERDSHLDVDQPDLAVDEEGEVAEHLDVYGREGKPCLRCRKPIQHTEIAPGLWTYHCSSCMI